MNEIFLWWIIYYGSSANRCSKIQNSFILETFSYAKDVGGMLLDWVVGAKLVEGLNLMFNTTRFTRDLIPLACATLATIGRYFKASQSNTNKSN